MRWLPVIFSIESLPPRTGLQLGLIELQLMGLKYTDSLFAIVIPVA
jgi:hypothetical protein